MKSSRLSLLAAGLLAAMAVAACDYAKRSDLAALQSRLQATQDSLARLWQISSKTFSAFAAFDTIPPPPKCPPHCAQLDSLRHVLGAWPAR